MKGYRVCYAVQTVKPDIDWFGAILIYYFLLNLHWLYCKRCVHVVFVRQFEQKKSCYNRIYQWCIVWSSMNTLQHTSLSVSRSFFVDICDSPVFFTLSVSKSATGSDVACPIGLCNVLCTWVLSAALSQVFVRASCRQPAIYLRTTITMCSAELFLDVMLQCFVLHLLKICPYLAGHGLQIQSVLFLIRACKSHYCVV